MAYRFQETWLCSAEGFFVGKYSQNAGLAKFSKFG